jgi:dihydroorotate dehydrogenase (fumarate)/dihydroorotate dehydrogenase
MSLYTSFLRPLLFRFDAETAHHGTVEACHWLGAVPGVPMLSRALLENDAPSLRTGAAGLSFANPIGLAAGWDKSGRCLRMIDAMGFGFAEIGSVSARPSRGNPKPRLFRLPADRAIIVNYGLPNEGAEVVAARLATHRPLGVNIVKTNDGPDAPPCSDDDILTDYERSVSLLHPHAAYLSLNISCPNAKGGKDFFAQPRQHHATAGAPCADANRLSRHPENRPA